MTHWIKAAQTVLPVFLVIGLGVICRSRSLVSREGIQSLKYVAVNICLPAVLFGAFATAQYSLSDLVIPLMMAALCMAGWFLGRWGAKRLGLNSRFVPFLTCGFEAGMLGYALFQMLYGAEKVTWFARIDLGQVLFVFTVYKILLSLESGKAPDRKKLLREMLSSPIIAAIVLGVVLGATGLWQALAPSGITGVLSACTDLIAAPTSVLILLAIGYDLVLRDIPWRAALQTALLRLAVMAVLYGLFSLFLTAVSREQGLREAALLMFLLPPPFVLPVFADDAGQRVYVSSVLSVSTLFAIAGFCVLAALGSAG